MSHDEEKTRRENRKKKREVKVRRINMRKNGGGAYISVVSGVEFIFLLYLFIGC